MRRSGTRPFYIALAILSATLAGCAPTAEPAATISMARPPLEPEVMSSPGSANPTLASPPQPTASPAWLPTEAQGRRLLFRQGFLEGYDDSPQRAWGTVEHLADSGQRGELLRFSPDFRAESRSIVEVALTESLDPTPEEARKAPLLAQVKPSQRVQEFPLPGGQFNAVILREEGSGAILAIAPLPPKSECDQIPPESVLVKLDPSNRYTSCLYLDETEDLGLTGTPQEVELSSYRLVVNGAVENPLSLTYQELRAYRPHSEVALLICPYTFADAAEWTGVPLSTILAEAKPRPNASRAAFIALDGYQKVLSLRQLERNGAFLAYWLNGEPLSAPHGYPLRLVAPGQGGHDWVKWLARIEILEE